MSQNEPRSMTGRVAIVTGAADGLGAAFAAALARAGAAVGLCDLSPAVVDVAARLDGSGARALGQVVDIRDRAAVQSFTDRVVQVFGGLNILVNNAAVVRLTSPLDDDLAQAEWDAAEVIGTNLTGTFLMGRAAIPHLMVEGGDLVNVTTDHIHTCGYPIDAGHAPGSTCPWSAVRRPALGGAAFDVYDASKWGLRGLTAAWAKALHPHGVRVNSFGMGPTITPMYLSHLKGAAPPPGTLLADDVADVLVDLIAEGPGGRTGDSVQVWAGHDCRLPEPSLDARLLAATLT